MGYEKGQSVGQMGYKQGLDHVGQMDYKKVRSPGSDGLQKGQTVLVRT